VYEVGGRPVATRRAFGEALAALARRRADVVAIDAEVANSTHLDLVEQVAPERSFQMYIAEQQMVATAIGMHVRGWTAFAATFAAFLSRAHDFVRMAVISRADLRLCGSHAGVAIGQDGPSQMGLEDLAAFRALGSSTVLYPSDPNQTAQLVEQMADTRGVAYIRTTRGAYPTLYEAGETFTIGGAHAVRRSAADQVVIIGAGVTLHEALAAADRLAADGVQARVIDLYSIKPIDAATLLDAAHATGGRLITVEDHWPQGGLGAAVLDALAEADVPARVVKLAVTHVPGSGTPSELLADCGIDAAAIVAAAHRLLEPVPLGRRPDEGPPCDHAPRGARPRR
jgi:transketolase